jgi:hypothetical protein
MFLEYIKINKIIQVNVPYFLNYQCHFVTQ